MAITFRPHHFLCAYCFQGRGYTGEFIANFSAIMQQLNDDETIEIEVVPHTDSLCFPCPHKRDLLCTTQEKILQLDEGHAEVLGISPGEKISWHNAKKRIQEKITLEKFHHICSRCEWKKLGICESVLNKNHTKQR